MLPPDRRGLNGESWSLKKREPRSGAIRANRTETGKNGCFTMGALFGINTPARGAPRGGSVANTVLIGTRQIGAVYVGENLLKTAAIVLLA